MPYISMQTNVQMTGDQEGEVLAKLSAAIAKTTGKPESVVQAAVQSGLRMMMAGKEAPTAYVSVKGIGFPQSYAAETSAAVCRVLAEVAGIEGKRVYIAFDAYEGGMWGVDSRTF